MTGKFSSSSSLTPSINSHFALTMKDLPFGRVSLSQVIQRFHSSKSPSPVTAVTVFAFTLLGINNAIENSDKSSKFDSLDRTCIAI